MKTTSKTLPFIIKSDTTHLQTWQNGKNNTRRFVNLTNFDYKTHTIQPVCGSGVPQAARFVTPVCFKTGCESTKRNNSNDKSPMRNKW